jgi:ParB family chromosome partitioning protein
MAPKNKGLGRGLDALLATSKSVADKEALSSQNDGMTRDADNDLKKIPIEFLRPGKYQPRKDMADEALEELAASIRSQGIIQPIVVRQTDKNQYEIIAGERRWRAAQIARLDVVPCLIKNIADDAAIAVALIENIQREDLNSMEEAQALDRLMVEFDLTHQQVADAVGKSRATVSNLLRLNGLETAVKTLLEHGDIDMGHARALLSLSGVEQQNIAKIVAEKGLTVRETERLVKKTQEEPVSTAPASQAKVIDPDVKRLATSLAERLGAAVKIDHNQNGKGKVTISFNDLDQLEGILSHIRVVEEEQ